MASSPGTSGSVTGAINSAGLSVGGGTMGGVGPSMMMPQMTSGGMGPNGSGNFPMSNSGGFIGSGPGAVQNFMGSGPVGGSSHMMMNHMHGQGMTSQGGMGMGGNGFPGNGPAGNQIGSMMNSGMGMGGPNNPNMMRMMGNAPGVGCGMMGGPPHMRGGPQFMNQQMRPPFGGPGNSGPGGMPMMGPNNGPGGVGPMAGPMHQQQNLIQVKPNAPNTIQYLPTRTQLQQQQHQQQQMMRGAGPIM